MACDPDMITTTDAQAAIQDRYEVVIVGGGPAGLSAALVLGRARRRVLLCDSGQYRNSVSRALHGFLTRDGTPPAEFLAMGRREIAKYDSVQVVRREVVETTRADGGFNVVLSGGARTLARKLILATGVVDELPSVEGAAALFGRGVYVCPYCDGWEVRDTPLAAYGKGDDKGAGLALELTQWSRDIVLCTDGPAELTDACRERLSRFGIAIHEEAIAKFEGGDGAEAAMEGTSVRIVFRGGASIVKRALFFNTGRHQRSDLARRLGCAEWGTEGCRLESKVGKTSVRGLYVVGDASRDVLQVVVATAEGAEAAITVNTELLTDDGIL